MKQFINIAGCLLVVAGCSFTAWSVYVIRTESYVTLDNGAESGFAPWPRIVITSPATYMVSQPIIRVTGYIPAEIATITYGITNVAGINANQVDCQRKGYITARFPDQAKVGCMTHEMVENRFQPWKPEATTERMEPAEPVFTTNFFQLCDINLAKGKNRITIHVRDKNGNLYSMKRYYTLDLTSDTTPSGLILIGPAKNAEVAGDNFTLAAQVGNNDTP